MAQTFESLPKYQELFDQMDEDLGGLISFEEFKEFFSKQEPFKSQGGQDYLDFVFRLMDTDNNKKISFYDFIPFARGYFEMKNYGNKQWYYLCFRTLDTDGSGEIGLDEIRQLLFYWGKATDDETCQRYIDYLDTDKNGSVSFDEFIALWN